MSNIWFSSDFHYNHNNRVSGVSNWSDKTACRKFDTLEEHNSVLVENINRVVKADDILYFTGDWSFGGIGSIPVFRELLNVKTIHFIGGNHDHHIRNNKIIRIANGFVNAQNLFSSYNELLEKKIGGQTMILCHYAMRTWHKASKGTWMLYGHSHGELPTYSEVIVTPSHESFADSVLYGESYVHAEEVAYKTMDIGIDTHPEFRPYHLDEIRKIMNKRVNLGHHNE